MANFDRIKFFHETTGAFAGYLRVTNTGGLRFSCDLVDDKALAYQAHPLTRDQIAAAALEAFCGGADWGPKPVTTRPVKRGLVAAVLNVCRARKAAEALTTAEGAAVAEGEEPTCSGE